MPSPKRMAFLSSGGWLTTITLRFIITSLSVRILSGKKWREGVLDYHGSDKEPRIQVLKWKNLEKLEQVYHTRPKSLRLLINYFPVVGFGGLITKTWSRLREERRNEKYVSCGIGKIIESADRKKFPEGETVGFIAPWHPALAERIVLPESLVFKVPEAAAEEMPEDTILYSPFETREPRSAWWKDVRAWSIYSGVPISEKTREELAEGLAQELESSNWSRAP